MLGEVATRREGFTSLEAAVALAISAGIIGVALTAFSTWAERVADSERRLLAIKTAEALVARLGLDLRLVAQHHRGQQAGFIWEFVVGPGGPSPPSARRVQARFSAWRHGSAAPFVTIEVPVAPAITR